MAFVWKHPKSQFWFARYRDSEGRKRNRSTQETNRRKATLVAQAWERGAELAKRGQLTRARAKTVLDDLMANVGVDPAPVKATEAVVADWLKDIEGEVAEATLNRYRGVTKGFLAHLGDRALAPVTTLSSADVQGFIGARGKEVAGKTALNDLRCLSACFSRAVRLGLLDRSPCLGVSAPYVAASRRRPFTAAQVRLLLAAAPTAQWRALIAALWFTGLRLGDGANLDWGEVDLGAGILRRRQKTGAEVVIPLHPALLRVLEDLAGDAGGPVFPELAGQRAGGKAGLSAQFLRIVREAGIDAQRARTKAGRSLAAYSAHSLRHGATTSLADADVVHPDVRRKLTGHADERSHAAYSHHAVETLRRAVAAIPDPTAAEVAR
jgi:integrase